MAVGDGVTEEVGEAPLPPPVVAKGDGVVEEVGEASVMVGSGCLDKKTLGAGEEETEEEEEEKEEEEEVGMESREVSARNGNNDNLRSKPKGA